MTSYASEYGVARTSAPVLNTPDFRSVFGGESGHDLKTDRCGQVRELEYIALPGSVFTILKKNISGEAEIYQVETDDYVAPPNVRLYVDGRFLQLLQNAPTPRKVSLPPREEIVAELRKSVGSHYVWGGNIRYGVPEVAEWYYAGAGSLGKERLKLAGLDCSGLLYHATKGWTPRNTSQLVTYGKNIAIEGKSSAEIATLLQPLDLIVWNGHVIIVLDRQTAIESRLECNKLGNGGVVLSSLSPRIAEVMRSRLPTTNSNNKKIRPNSFVVRRWYAP